MLQIEGIVVKILFHNDQNGYTVGILKSSDIPSTTFTGYFHKIDTDTHLTLEGDWVEHPRYGKQFAVSSWREVEPEDFDAIEKYLSGKIFPGIGDGLASKIVDRFGRETLEVLDNDLSRLKEVKGIGQKKLAQISELWEKYKSERDAIIFLNSLGFGGGMVPKIMKLWGERSEDKIKENPYKLIGLVDGIGFRTTDKIALNLGFLENSPCRLKALIVFILSEGADNGHTYLPLNPLVRRCASSIGVSVDEITDALYQAEAEGEVVIENVEENDIYVYLPQFYAAESESAFLMRSLQKSAKSVSVNDLTKVFNDLSRYLDIELSGEQYEAVLSAIREKILIITGGPGTGKTTIIRVIINVYKALDAKIVLAAPTGRAAKRIFESTGLEAKTIHRLLEYNPVAGYFARDEENQLEGDLFIIDEMSMVDTLLFWSLLKALPESATIVLIGDADQLPSVGAGAVLYDLINSDIFTVMKLNTIFRQAKTSRIVVNAHKINHGEVPEPEDFESGSDFIFIEASTPAKAAEIIKQLCYHDIPEKFGIRADEDIQVMAPMYKGTAGVTNLNLELQNILNPEGSEIRGGNVPLRIGDKVMQIKNNYEKDVFNGDTGRILNYERREKKASILFENRVVEYEYSDLEEIVPAYAISIHKSQGSEYPAVVLPLMAEHSIMLQRRLLYTAVTRGKQLVVITGAPHIFRSAVKNNKWNRRFTNFCSKLTLQS